MPYLGDIGVGNLGIFGPLRQLKARVNCVDPAQTDGCSSHRQVRWCVQFGQSQALRS